MCYDFETLDLKENKSLKSEIVRHPWETARAEIVWSLLKRNFRKNDGQPIHILDVGAGDLFQSVSLAQRDRRISITAFDTAYTPENQPRFSSNIKGENVKLAQKLSDLQDVDHYSVVLLMDVLEHIKDDQGFLKNLVKQSFIQPDTVFLITVPAWQYLFSGHDKFLEHYRRYNPATLSHLSQACDLKTIDQGSLFFSLWLFRTLQTGIRHLFRSKEILSSDLNPWTGSKWMASVLKFCLIMDYSICKMLKTLYISLPGLSLFSICKKA